MASWTQKTYRMVAEALHSEYESAETLDAKTAIMNVGVTLGQQFRADNPRFDTPKFYNAITGK